MKKKHKKIFRPKGNPRKNAKPKHAKNLPPVDLKNHVIALHGDMRTAEPPIVQCSCGWSEGPDSNLMNLGLAAKKHSIETGHEMRRHA